MRRLQESMQRARQELNKSTDDHQQDYIMHGQLNKIIPLAIKSIMLLLQYPTPTTSANY
jgi:hypothetical protein